MFFKNIRRWFRRPSNPSGHVYYARLRTPQGIFYKLGYTSKPSLHERMAYGGTGDELLIDKEFLFSFQPDAWDIEQTLLEHFDNLKAFGKYSNDKVLPLAGRGQSELFHQDVLGLDDALYRESIVLTEQEVASALNEQGQGCLMTLAGLVLAPFTLGLSLFLIFGGLSSFFDSSNRGSSSDNQTRKIAVTRPLHPPKIQALLDRLRTPA